MIRKIALAVSATTILAVPAFAGNTSPAPADPVPMAPVAISVSDWTGAYAGVQLGYGDLEFGAASGDGIIGGAQLGYDYDMGNIVVGAELDYNMSNISLGGTDIDQLARLKLRVGYDAGDALIYAVGGGARAMTSTGNDNGWVAGAGVEYRVMERVSVGGEYLYHNFDNFNGSGSDLTGGTFAARINFRF
ncbi:MAG: outer membrane protein [Pseudooceanicola sp.]